MLSMILLTAVLVSPQEPPAGAPAAAQPAASPSSAEEAISAGIAHFKRRRFAQAEEHFRRAVEADPSSAAAHFYLGYTIYKRAEPKRPFHPGKQEAAQHFAKAYELDPAFKPAWGPRT